MKALFVVPPSHEPNLIVDAWISWNEPALHKTFDPWGEPKDREILQTAKDASPDVIFYVGGNEAPGLPSHDTLRDLRSLAPLIHLCWDATDQPWHDVLITYKKDECFDLQVALDGGTDSPVDMATLTPIDPGAYKNLLPRTIKCGFSGGCEFESRNGLFHPRVDVLRPLIERGAVKYRERNNGLYSDYAAYLKRCYMVLNISHTGSGKAHHVKVRVVETGHAGAALLEMVQAPTRNWIPEELFFSYSTVEEAVEIISSLNDVEMAQKASEYRKYVCEYYSPQRIYKSILARL